MTDPLPLDRAWLVPLDDIAAAERDLGRRPRVLTRPDGELEFWITDRDEVVLYGYSDQDLVIRFCGPGQPSTVVGAAELAGIQSVIGRPLLLALDLQHPEGERYPETDIRERDPLEHAETVAGLTEVWLPARPPHRGAAGIEVELYSFGAGEPMMLLAYRTVDELHAACGAHQVAVSVRADLLGRIAAEAGAAEVRFDVALSQELRRDRPVVDWVRTPVCVHEQLPGVLDEQGAVVGAQGQSRDRFEK